MIKRIVPLALLVPAFVVAQAPTPQQGVFEYVIQSASVSFEAAAASIESTAASAGWRVAAKIKSGVPNGCAYRSTVFVLVDSAYARRIMQANRTTGPFAITDRVNLFEDERGLHVAIVNPHSINRTVLMDDVKYASLSEQHLQALRAAITKAVPGSLSTKQFGQQRDQGYIGRTMGVMAGGRFDGRIGDDAVVPASDWREVGKRVQGGLSTTGPRWGLHLVYAYELPEFQTTVLGVTGTPMDAKSFDIVKAGSDDGRSAFKCAGVDHAAAYPLEIVVAQEKGAVRVRQVDAMFRMKMYFEDAGKIAFMKNMTMPGSIHDELKSQILAGLAIQR